MLMKLQAMVLFAAAASNDEGTAPDAGPRGRRNHSDEDELRQGRVLLEIDGMACEEHSAKDGFVVCTFRAMPPSIPIPPRLSTTACTCACSRAASSVMACEVAGA